MQTNIRPLMHLNTLSKLYPGLWKQVNEIRSCKGKDFPDWPSWCFLPVAASCAIISKGGGLQSLFRANGGIAELSALIAWRYTQGIYSFSSTVYDDLVKTVPKGDIPVEVLYRLPEWGIYIELQDEPGCYGFFAHLEYNVKSHRSELRLLIDRNGMSMPIILLLGDWTISEAIDRSLSRSSDNAGMAKSEIFDLFGFEHAEFVERQSKLAGKCISLLLYLCSEKPDIGRIDNELPQHAAPKKTRKGLKLFPPSKPKIWNVGEKTAELIKNNNKDWQGGRHSSPKAHIRRAHWHGYWTGSKNSAGRKFIYKWIPTLVVNSQ